MGSRAAALVQVSGIAQQVTIEADSREGPGRCGLTRALGQSRTAHTHTHLYRYRIDTHTTHTRHTHTLIQIQDRHTTHTHTTHTHTHLYRYRHLKVFACGHRRKQKRIVAVLQV